MRAAKIYLETTMFNYYFDKDREAYPATVRLFEEIAEGKYLPYTSRYVLDELGNAQEPKRSQMLALVEKYSITTLDYSKDAEKLADMYVAETFIPPKYRTDGIHIAVATVNDLDMILSLNFRHIVRKRTVEGAGAINILAGYRPISIHTPQEVADYE
jgi:predicted nucleic acid-binding protein